VAQKNIRAEQVKANKTDLYTYIPCTGYLTLPYLWYIYIYFYARLRNVEPGDQVSNQKKDVLGAFFAGFSFATSLINEHQPSSPSSIRPSLFALGSFEKR